MRREFLRWCNLSVCAQLSHRMTWPRCGSGLGSFQTPTWMHTVLYAPSGSSATLSQVRAQLRYIGLIRYADPDEKAMLRSSGLTDPIREKQRPLGELTGHLIRQSCALQSLRRCNGCCPSCPRSIGQRGTRLRTQWLRCMIHPCWLMMRGFIHYVVLCSILWGYWELT